MGRKGRGVKWASKFLVVLVWLRVTRRVETEAGEGRSKVGLFKGRDTDTFFALGARRSEGTSEALR